MLWLKGCGKQSSGKKYCLNSSVFAEGYRCYVPVGGLSLYYQLPLNMCRRQNCVRVHLDVRMSRNKKPPGIAARGFSDRNLTMSYSHMGKPHTTIGDAAFHFWVRNGIRWDHCSIVVRQTVRDIAFGYGAIPDLLAREVFESIKRLGSRSNPA